jgi:DNA helicase HerA-like ATPase
MLDRETLSDTFAKIPLKILNTQALTAGATDTGTTKTIQVLSEQLSLRGIPVLMTAIKGDFNGIAAPSEASPFLQDRHQKINLSY